MKMNAFSKSGLYVFYKKIREQYDQYFYIFKEMNKNHQK